MLKKALQKLNKIISLMLAVIMCISMLPISAKAAEGDSGDPKWVDFTNEFSAVISIDVTKQVIGDPAPAEDRFCFRISIGNDEKTAKYAREQEYILYNADKQRVYGWINEADEIATTLDENVKPDEDHLWSEYPWKTDKSGKFFLHDGEIASFEGIILNKYYKVEELLDEAELAELPEGAKRGEYVKLTQDQTGSLTDKGASLVFKNQYSIPNDNGELKVYKRISADETYQLPADNENHEFKGIFSYQLKINNKVWANKEFKVYPVDVEDATPVTQTTDAEGRFQLCGDEYALFGEVPSDAQYDIVETQYDADNTDAVWWAVGEDAEPDPESGILDSRRGTTPGNVYFMNSRYSFMVSKILKEGTEDKYDTDFNFILTNAAGERLEARYYLYKTNGTMIEEEIHTAINGEFSLKAFQTALFVDVPLGTVYNVMEVADAAYKQIAPAENDGYTNKEVTDNIQNNIFENEILDNSGLSVTKQVKDESGTLDKSKDYIFVLSKYDESDPDNKGYKPVANAFYNVNVNGTNESRATDENGVFTLNDNQTAYFTTLLPGDYRVEEIIKKEDKKYFSVDIIDSEVKCDQDKVDTVEVEKLHSDKSEINDTVKPLGLVDYDKYVISKIPVQSEKSVSVNVVNKIKDYYFNINKIIHVDDRTGESDKAQSFVFKIEYLGKDMNGDPLRTFYTSIKCTNKLNDGSLIIDDPESRIGGYYMYSGMTTVKTNIAGWYRISEVMDWSITDYDFKKGSNKYLEGTHTDGSYSEMTDDGYVYFKIEDEYDIDQTQAKLPTASFTNEESIYAFRSGQAYFDNVIKKK